MQESEALQLRKAVIMGNLPVPLLNCCGILLTLMQVTRSCAAGDLTTITLHCGHQHPLLFPRGLPVGCGATDCH